MAGGTLGEFEVVVLLAVLHAGPQAYGSAIRDEIERRFNPARMTALEIDPNIWEHAAPDETRPLDRLLAGYEDLCAFVDAATEASAGAIVYVG